MISYRHRNYYPYLLIAIVLAVFGNSLLNGFVWDDVVYSVGTDVYKEFNIRKMLFSCGNGFEYRPIRDITRAIDYAIWGDFPAGHHVSNLFFYVGAVLALYFLTVQVSKFHDSAQRRSDFDHQTFAFITALLFSVHPLHSEVVSFLGSRSALLAGIFVFLCCSFYLFFLKGYGCSRKVSLSISLVCFLGALLSYPAAITIPLMLLYFVFINGAVHIKRNLFSLLPFFVLSLIFFLIYKRVAVAGGAIVDNVQILAGIGIQAKIAKAIEISYFYVNKLVVPINLSPEYVVVFAKSLAKPLVVAELTILTAIIVLSVRNRRAYPDVFFAVCWYLVTLIPVSNFFATTPAVADRYAFLPSYAFFFILAALLFRIPAGYKLRLAKSFALLLVFFWSLAAGSQNAIWRNDRRLWEETLSRSPSLVKAYDNLGVTYLNEGNYVRALEYFSQMKTINLHGAAKYDFYQGVIHEKNGELALAAAAYERSLAKEPDTLMAQYYLGGVYFRMGELARAAEHYAGVLISNEVDPGGLRKLAGEQQSKISTMLYPQLDSLRSRVSANQADAGERVQFAIQLDMVGYYEEALRNYLDIAKNDASNWQLYFNIANIYKKLGNNGEAAAYYEKSLAINPGYVDSLNNLGVVYKSMKKYDQAVTAFEKAIKANGAFAFAPYNLATTYYLKGEKEKAITYLRYTREHFPELEGSVNDFLKSIEER